MNNLKYKLVHSYRKKGILPNGYTHLEYIESTGTQYFDTGIYLTGSDDMKFVFERTKKDGVLWQYAGVFGADNGWLVNTYGLYLDRGFVYNNACSIESGSEVYYYEPNKKYIVELVNAEYYRDGIKKFTFEKSDFSCVNTALLFARRRRQVVESSTYIRVYELKVKRNNRYILNYLPALDDKGKPCMYDTVTKKSFYNSGTGEFIAGPVVTQ